jgi:hypothetical protein
MLALILYNYSTKGYLIFLEDRKWDVNSRPKCMADKTCALLKARQPNKTTVPIIENIFKSYTLKFL